MADTNLCNEIHKYVYGESRSIIKKFLLIIATSLIVTGCASLKNTDQTQIPKTNEKEETIKHYNYRDKISSESIDIATVSADQSIDISDVNQLRDFDSNVFIGTVESIDGCSTTAAENAFNPIPYEYGKISVLKNLKGQTNSNTINFARNGGVISIADYEKNAPKEMIENDDKHRKEAGQEKIDKASTYVELRYENDIILETGKTYLFFMNYVSSTNTYIVNGVQYGTREIYQPSSKSSLFRKLPNESTLQVKNNDTGEFESLDEFIDLYFPS
ncbi:MAG: hypothetical protein ACLTW1_20215 [[Clostridium] innocuum]